MIRILIADDHGIVREGLRSLIEKEPEMEVVGEAWDGEMAIDLADGLRPDIVIMDITMPKLNGIEAIRRILRKRPSTKVISLSMHAEGHIVREALEVGALGYVLKSYLFDELARAVRAVIAKERYLSPRITDVLVHDWFRRGGRKQNRPSGDLSDRERRILQLTSEGKSVKEIALDLYVSTKTIHANRRRLMEKLDVSSVAELTKFAISQGLTSVEF